MFGSFLTFHTMSDLYLPTDALVRDTLAVKQRLHSPTLDSHLQSRHMQSFKPAPIILPPAVMEGDNEMGLEMQKSADDSYDDSQKKAQNKAKRSKTAGAHLSDTEDTHNDIVLDTPVTITDIAEYRKTTVDTSIDIVDFSSHHLNKFYSPQHKIHRYTDGSAIDSGADMCAKYGDDSEDMNGNYRMAVPICTAILDYIDCFDKYYSGFIHRLEMGWFDIFILLPAMTFSPIGLPVFIVWLWWRNHTLVLGKAALVVFIFSESFKYVFRRPRPSKYTLGKKKFNLRGLQDNPSMPSGDTAQAAVVATTLVWHGYAPWWLLAIPAAGFGRVYFGPHYLCDTMVGAAIGCFLTSLVNFYYLQIHLFDQSISTVN